MFDIPFHINLFISLTKLEHPLKTSNKRTHIALPIYFVKVGLSPSKKICVIYLIKSLLKMTKNTLYFILKAPSVVKIIKFLSRIFGYVEKTAWLERQDYLQNSWSQNLVYKQLHTHIAQYFTK